jgi:hypothetical protein
LFAANVFFVLFNFQARYATAMMRIAPTAAPTPMPAWTAVVNPVDSFDSEDESVPDWLDPPVSSGCCDPEVDAAAPSVDDVSEPVVVVLLEAEDVAVESGVTTSYCAWSLFHTAHVFEGGGRS